jgi:predicted RNA-binding protein with TRAM domain
MLPVEPGMAKFVSKDVTPSGYGQALAEINGFCVVVPDTVGIRVPTVHVGI